jgi:hypothetical protein
MHCTMAGLTTKTLIYERNITSGHYADVVCGIKIENKTLKRWLFTCFEDKILFVTIITLIITNTGGRRYSQLDYSRT